MKSNIKIKILSLVVITGIIPTLVFAAPGIPHQFYGTAKYINGSNITSGNVIVKIGATQVALVPISNGRYGYNPNLLLITDSDNDKAGSTLKFFIGSVDTGKTDIFENGGYTEFNLTIAVPSDTVSGGGSNVSLSSATAGNADMPTGATNVVLTNTTVLNLSSGLVGREVTLQSGVEGQPVVLTNSNLSNISASIPDGTKIQGPTGWDGKITPPVAGTASGTAPAGFSVGSTVISIGSSDGTLVFDKPVTLLLSGVTGTVGYKPAGSDTWIRITNTCGGNYATPTAPTAPGECSISNGTDTKIVTFHFTSFGSLTTVSSGGNNGGGGGNTGGGGGGNSPPSSSSTPTPTPALIPISLSEAAKKVDANNDGKIDVLDFNSLMVNWGNSGGTGDFDGNGTVDVLDFNMLMINWS